MILGKKVAVVMPAYNAEKTLNRTVDEIPSDVVDELILVDDCSVDMTVDVALSMGIKVIKHKKNLGYGGNQKTCYAAALDSGADVVIMLHPDYQYSPKLLLSLGSMVASGVYDCALGSRILGGTALKGGMPRYKYLSNRALTFIQNLLIGQKLSEYHTGYRAFSAEVLRELPLLENSDDFIFDNEMLSQIHFFGFRIGEISCPTKYFPEASSIKLSPSIRYGFGVLGVSLKFIFARAGCHWIRIFNRQGKKLTKVQFSQFEVLSRSSKLAG